MAFRKRTYLQDKSLFISAGHSDTDPGAVGNGVTEADIVLDFRDLIAAELRDRGIVFSRDGEQSQNLPLRTAVKLAAGHQVAVEFHCNAAGNPNARGVETLSREKDYALGRKLCEAVADALLTDNRGAKPEDSGQHSRLAFVTDGGGLILELFFLTSPHDLEQYELHAAEAANAVAEVLAEAVSTITEDE